MFTLVEDDIILILKIGSRGDVYK
ncbi:MAG: hypothetical protein ACP5UJ_08595 [Athalassotoga sp.]